ALTVHQAHARQRYAKIARSLEVIPRQNTEASGVDRNALVDTKLCREIGNAARVVLAVSLLEPSRGAHVVVKALFNSIHVGQQAIVALKLFQACLFDSAKQLDRAVLHGLEQIVIDAPKQRNGLMIPAPPQVVGEFVETLQTWR